MAKSKTASKSSAKPAAKKAATKSPKAKAATKKAPAKSSNAKKAATKTAVAKKTAKATDAEVVEKLAAENVATVDRRREGRRTEGEEAAKTVTKTPGMERRKKVNRRRQIDPTTCERDYSDQEVEFMNALDEYKRTSGRMFPTCSEVLEVVRSIGYVRLSPAELAAHNAAHAAEATENELVDDSNDSGESQQFEAEESELEEQWIG